MAATKPAAPTLIAGALADLLGSTPHLVAEDALPRRRLLVLRRSVRRPRCTPADRALPVLLAGRVRTRRSARSIVQPNALLRRHREMFRQFRRRQPRSGPLACRPTVPGETIALIRELAAANPLRDAGRSRGALRQRHSRVAKWSVQQYLRGARPPRRSRQAWATLVRNHADDTWACDFLPGTDLLFRPAYASFVLALGSRRVVQVGVTRHPADAWVAQQLREATPEGRAPTYLIRDNDSKYGQAFTRVAQASGIAVLRTAYRAPQENAACERFLGSVRRECLDHLLIVGEAHLHRVLSTYVTHYNQARPHQGLEQRCPLPSTERVEQGPIRCRERLGGLLREYYREAA